MGFTMNRTLRLFVMVAALLGVASRPRAELLVSSFSSNRVFRYSEATGAFLDIFISNANGALSLPHRLAFGPDGNLYAVGRFNNRVARYNGTTGAFVDVFATTNLSQPFGLRFGVDGFLCVVSGSSRASRSHFFCAASCASQAFQNSAAGRGPVWALPGQASALQFGKVLCKVALSRGGGSDAGGTSQLSRSSRPAFSKYAARDVP